MIATPNCTVTILGGNTSTDFGDVLDSDEPAGTGIPCSIVQGRQIVSTESDAQARAVLYYTGRLPAGTVVTDAQRLRDDTTGRIFSIDHVHADENENPAMPGDVRLDLRRVV